MSNAYTHKAWFFYRILWWNVKGGSKTICYVGLTGGAVRRDLWTILRVVVTAVAQWLRFCATNRKVADSIPAGVSGFFIDI
jgi:hypothetical protein